MFVCRVCKMFLSYISCFNQIIGINYCFSSTSSLIWICTETKKKHQAFFHVFQKTPGFLSTRLSFHHHFFHHAFFSVHLYFNIQLYLFDDQMAQGGISIRHQCLNDPEHMYSSVPRSTKGWDYTDGVV